MWIRRVFCSGRSTLWSLSGRMEHDVRLLSVNVSEAPIRGCLSAGMLLWNDTKTCTGSYGRYSASVWLSLSVSLPKSFFSLLSFLICCSDSRCKLPLHPCQSLPVSCHSCSFSSSFVSCTHTHRPLYEHTHPGQAKLWEQTVSM